MTKLRRRKIIQELPMFLDGLQTIYDDTVYSVILYPGMGKLDELVDSIWQDEQYVDLRRRLNLKQKAGIVDVRFGD